MNADGDNIGIELARELIRASTAAGRAALELGDREAFAEHYDRADRAVGRLGELLELRDRRHAR